MKKWGAKYRMLGQTHVMWYYQVTQLIPGWVNSEHIICLLSDLVTWGYVSEIIDIIVNPWKVVQTIANITERRQTPW